MLAAGDQSESPSKHVGREKLHSTLHNGRVRGDWWGRRASTLGSRIRGEHGDGEEGRTRGVSEVTVTEKVTVSEISLDERDLFDASHALLVTVWTAAEGFQPRDKAFPWILGHVVLSSVVGLDDELD
jgi:hypothetical protein